MKQKLEELYVYLFLSCETHSQDWLLKQELHSISPEMHYQALPSWRDGWRLTMYSKNLVPWQVIEPKQWANKLWLMTHILMQLWGVNYEYFSPKPLEIVCTKLVTLTLWGGDCGRAKKNHSSQSISFTLDQFKQGIQHGNTITDFAYLSFWCIHSCCCRRQWCW